MNKRKQTAAAHPQDKRSGKATKTRLGFSPIEKMKREIIKRLGAHHHAHA